MEWRPIPGFNGYYEVSDTGVFRRVRREVTYRRGGYTHNDGKPRTISTVIPERTLTPVPTNTTGTSFVVTLTKNGAGKQYSCNRIMQQVWGKDFVSPKKIRRIAK